MFTIRLKLKSNVISKEFVLESVLLKNFSLIKPHTKFNLHKRTKPNISASIYLFLSHLKRVPPKNAISMKINGVIAYNNLLGYFDLGDLMGKKKVWVYVFLKALRYRLHLKKKHLS